MRQLDKGLAGLAELDLSAVPIEEVRELALEVERLSGRLRGVSSRMLAVVAEAEPEGAAWWWRDGLGISGEAAGQAVRRSSKLAQLPSVEDAVVSGDLSLEQAGALTPLVGRLDPDELHDRQPELIDGARGRTVDSIGRWVRHLIAVNSEDDLNADAAALEGKRGVFYRFDPDGMLRGRFALTPDQAESFLTVLEPLARKDGKEDPRSVAQRRADGFADVFIGATRWADLPDAGGQRAHVSYVISAEWAAGVTGADPAVGAWTGPQTRSALESALCDARITRVLLDERGQVASLFSVSGDITRSQRRAVSARDRCCVARDCSRPPAFCDVHHLVERVRGGKTALDNLVLLCRRHHVMWHAGRLLLPDLEVPWLRKPLDPPMVA